MKDNVKVKCKKIIGINSNQYPQLAKRPSYSVLLNKKLTHLLDIKLNTWLEEHKELHEGL